MKEFWNHQIFSIGKFELTPGKLLGMVIVIIVTWFILYFIRKLLIGKRKLSVLQKGRKLSLYQLIKYFLWVIGISICITILGFDITILIAGSAALLVGLGFGLQNIFSDLVSGLFLLFEQKVRVGDVMEVDDIVGQVQEINLRTAVLFTRDGYNIIVPNHKFITENVVNWSHHSLERRFQIRVGVSYGSDVDLVTTVLLECTKGHDDVSFEAGQQPFVRFQDFGDSALIFDLYFWSTDMFRVEQTKSQMRYKIFKSFRENSIAIPFPQRDVHIIQP